MTVQTGLLMLALSCACVTAIASPSISVSDLCPGNVKGRLGKPLGTRTTIAGHYKSAMIENPLLVIEIDGVAVTNGAIIAIHGIKQLKEGVSYRLEGYESGTFGSSPDWLAPGAQQPFQFYSFFVVTSVLKPEKE